MRAAVADWGFEPALVGEPVPASETTARLEEQIFRWPPRRSPSPLRDIERREDLVLKEARSVDVAALPGRNFTIELLSREAEKRRLKSLIERFFHSPLSWEMNEGAQVTWETQLATLRFINLLPDDVKLPRVAPDGEGGITLHWETADHRYHLGGVADWQLHFVFDAGQAHARYVDDVTFNGDEIPSQILQFLKT